MRKIAVLISIVTLMAGAAVAASWSGDMKIASIEVSKTGAGAASVWLSFYDPPFTHTCSNKGQYVLGGDQLNVDRMTAIATLALLNSRAVKVFWGGGCSGGGNSGYPVLLGITLK